MICVFAAATGLAASCTIPPPAPHSLTRPPARHPPCRAQTPDDHMLPVSATATELTIPVLRKIQLSGLPLSPSERARRGKGYPRAQGPPILGQGSSLASVCLGGGRTR